MESAMSLSLLSGSAKPVPEICKDTICFVSSPLAKKKISGNNLLTTKRAYIIFISHHDAVKSIQKCLMQTRRYGGDETRSAPSARDAEGDAKLGFARK